MKSNKNATENKKTAKTKAENRPKNTTNYAPDSHRKFCLRCYAKNGGRCPATGRIAMSRTCDL